MFGFSNLWVAVAGAVIFGLIVWKCYAIGYDHGIAVSNVKIVQIEADIQKQYADQLNALSEAARRAEQNQSQLSDQLDKAESDLQKQLQINEELAHKDPNANTNGIGKDSVGRLNSIQ
jgi:uncharacterized phage infection (PIP) family protein YhgE